MHTISEEEIMNDTTLSDITTRLAVALDAQSKAKPYQPESNPQHTATLTTLLQGAGITKTADLLPQRNKYGIITQNEQMNQVVTDGLVARTNARSDQRKVASRARAMRKQQIDALADLPIEPNPERLAQAWGVLRPLVPTITRVAVSKAAWARRYLGAVQEDVTQTAMTKMVLVLAKGLQDLDLLLVAAEQLAGETERTGAMPGNQVSEADLKAHRKERKQQAKARKWLMGMINNRVMGALCDLYTERHNLRWENLDILDTVLASINGAGDDPTFAHHDASKPPHFIASRMASPGAMHPDVLRVAIAAAITERGLDRLCELLIDESNLTTNGAFMWTANAEQVFLATPEGAAKWDMVCFATDHHVNVADSRSKVAREYARQQFAFLPWLVRSVVESCDVAPIGWRDGYALMTSAFDPDSFAADGSRKRAGYLTPTIVAADVREAASLIVQHLACVLADYDAHA